MGRFALMILAVILAASPADARCIMSYCKDRAPASTPSRSYITNTSRQKVGDVYNPGRGRRIQIGDTSRRIIGYIERDGDITDKRRRKVGEIENLIGNPD